jgi:hypothetical protein
VVMEKTILDQFEEFALIGSRFLEHIGMRGRHGKGRRTLGESTKQESKVCKRGEEMATAEESGFGLNLSPLFIVATVKGGGLNGPHFSAEDFGNLLLKINSNGQNLTSFG